MSRIRIIALVIAAVLLIVVGVVFAVGGFKPSKAGILIESSPDSTVYIDGEQVGRTPYDKPRAPGEVTIRLVPDSFEEPLVPYVTKVTLLSGIKTVVRKDFSGTEELSSSEILSFEKMGGNEASLSIVTSPDSAQIIIDDTTRAFAPYKTSALTPGDHTLVVSSPGYVQRVIKLKTFEGFKLAAIVQLAKDLNYQEEKMEKEEKEEEVKEPEPDKVEILSTPTGFLRVRSEPSTLGKEIAQVEPGEIYVLLDEDEQTGWYKIELILSDDEEEDETSPKSGWISDQYAEKVEKDGEATPTETPSPTPTEEPEEELE